MEVVRIIKHIAMTQRRMRRCFPAASLAAIQAAIGAAEAGHLGEICFAVEAALPPGRVASGVSPRSRALEVFAEEHIWDTEHNCGVLIYVLLADRAIEIVADRGIHGKAGPGLAWRRIADAMQAAFAVGQFETGAVRGVSEVAAELIRHFPASRENPNELPNRVILR